MDAATIHREFGDKVSRLCRRMIRNRDTARDAAQEVWLEILQNIGAFEGRSELSTWIWTVARRTVWRHLKREKVYSTRFMAEYFHVREEDGIPDMERVPVEDRAAWVRLECEECLTGILHCLHNDDRFIYLLRVMGRLGYTDISLVMAMSEAAVRQSFSRSARKLRKFLDAECLLYNPAGSCRCRMKAPIQQTDTDGEHLKVKAMAKKMLFLEAADSFHPSIDWWKGLRLSDQ